MCLKYRKYNITVKVYTMGRRDERVRKEDILRIFLLEIKILYLQGL
jgi:hypothetical protein